MKDWAKTIQSLMEYLKGCLGVMKIPLAYVIRDEPGIFPDPPGGYSTRQQELIARAPIPAVGGASLTNPFTQTYLDDRSKVWELLSAITRDLECWSYVMPAQKTKNGRSAFFNLKLHYLGVNSKQIPTGAKQGNGISRHMSAYTSTNTQSSMHSGNMVNLVLTREPW